MSKTKEGIQFITADDTYALRHMYLRPGMPIDKCKYPTDLLTDTFHLGYFKDGKLVSIASFHRETYQNDPGLGYRLRGMCTDLEHRREGYAKALMDRGIEELTGRSVDYCWCNARPNAYKLYEAYGFKSMSKEFEIEGVGRHKVMLLKMKKSEE